MTWIWLTSTSYNKSGIPIYFDWELLAKHVRFSRIASNIARKLDRVDAALCTVAI